MTSTNQYVGRFPHKFPAKKSSGSRPRNPERPAERPSSARRRDRPSYIDRKYWQRIHLVAGQYVDWTVRKWGDPVDELMKAFPQAFQDFEVVSQRTFSRGIYVEIYRRID